MKSKRVTVYIRYSVVLTISILALLLMQACGNDSGRDASTIFQATVINHSTDTIRAFGVDLDLIPIDSNLIIEEDGKEISFQFEDRNVNGLPDKLFALVDLAPRSFKILTGKIAPARRTYPDRSVQALMIDGKTGSRLNTLQYESADQLLHQGVLLENEWIAYRALMKDPFAFDVIGKITERLVLDTVKSDLSIQAKWGGDILAEGTSMGLGSPAL